MTTVRNNPERWQLDEWLRVLGDVSDPGKEV